MSAGTVTHALQAPCAHVLQEVTWTDRPLTGTSYFSLDSLEPYL